MSHIATQGRRGFKIHDHRDNSGGPVEGKPLNEPKRFIKRSIDVVGALTLLILLSPLLLSFAALVGLTSSGPAFFRQTRVGLGGSEFHVWKFRTMRTGAQKQQAEVWTQGLSQGTCGKMRDDPRVTRIGRILRKYSIDELPQLINVLKGEMSLIGPRPMQPCEVATLASAEQCRHKTRPGMTGLWQVSGRSDVSWEERIRLDLQYVEQWSLTLDLVILVKTWRVVLTGKGAY